MTETLATYPVLEDPGAYSQRNRPPSLPYFAGELVSIPSTGSGRGYPGPFEISISGTTATFTNCVYQRQMCFIMKPAVPATTCTVAATGTVFVGFIVNESAGTITMSTGAAFTDISHASVPADQSQIKVPLYQITDGKVVCDFRKTPQTGLYV